MCVLICPVTYVLNYVQSKKKKLEKTHRCKIALEVCPRPYVVRQLKTRFATRSESRGLIGGAGIMIGIAPGTEITEEEKM